MTLTTGIHYTFLKVQSDQRRIQKRLQRSWHLCFDRSFIIYGNVGPFFFSSSITNDRYVEMLRNYFQSAVADWPNLSDVWYQHDGTLGHYSRIAREYLDEVSPDRWIGHHDPMEWPPRSPALSPPDFFAQGVVKDAVYSKKVSFDPSAAN